ncbi:MAG: S1C family serine protease [bacterium]
MNPFYRKFAIASSASLFLFPCLFTPQAYSGETLTDFSKALHHLIDSTKISVVTVVAKVSQEIYVEKESGILPFFKPERQRQALSYVNVGTGVIVDKDGHIVTRSSIVLGAEYCHVRLTNGVKLPAKIVSHDVETGFAVLKVDYHGLKPAHFGTSDAVSPGTWILMIGNSLGTFPSVDFGAVNGVQNNGLMQISANLNPGNNGSPIINLHGDVVGLVAGRINVPDNFGDPLDGYGYRRMALAYPINRVKRIVDDLIKIGYVRKGWLGVTGYADDKEPKIRNIIDSSPAKKAGLTKGDIVQRYGNIRVSNISELIGLVEFTTPGETIPIEFIRGDELFVTKLQIGEKPRTPSEVNRTLQAGKPADYIKSRETQSFERFPMDLFEKNRLLEKRIEGLEKEILKLKESFQSN